MKQLFKPVFSTLLGVLFVYLVLRGLDWGQTVLAVSKLNPGWLLAGLVLLAIAYVLKWYRWHYLVKYIHPEIRPNQTVGPFFIGVGVNNIAPTKLGEIARLIVLHIRSKVSKSAILSTIVVERVFDGLFLALIFLLGARFFQTPAWVTTLLNVSTLIFVGLGAVLYLAAFSHGFIARFFQRSKSSRLARWMGPVCQGIEALQILRRRKAVVRLSLLSVAVWVLEGGMYFVFLKAFGIHLPFFAAIVIMGVLNFGILVLTSPGSMGTFEFLIIKSLGLFSVGQNDAFAYAFVTHFFLYIPFIVIAGYYIVTWGLSFSDLKKLP